MNKSVYATFPLTTIVIFVAVLNECFSNPQLPDTMVKMKAVRDKVMNGYDRMIHPADHGSNSTTVLINFLPRQIIDVDETAGIVILDSFIYMEWNDTRLIWDKSEFSGSLSFSQDQIWWPDISVFNSHSMSINPQSEVLIASAGNGMVSWFPPILTQTDCNLMDATYPYGDVVCYIGFGSWLNDGWSINWSGFTHYLGFFENIHQRWELLEEKLNSTHNLHLYDGGVFHEMAIKLVMRRKPLPEIEATRVPCILVMLLTLSVFWMPPNSSKKVLVLGFQFWVLAVLIAYVAWNTKSPAFVQIAISFLLSTMYIVVAIFLLQILVIFNLCNFSGPARPPPLAMQLLNGPFGKYACLRWPLDNDLPLDRIHLKEDSMATLDSPTPRDDWMLFAAGLDRLFFVLASIAMIAIHHL